MNVEPIVWPAKELVAVPVAGIRKFGRLVVGVVNVRTFAAHWWVRVTSKVAVTLLSALIELSSYTVILTWKVVAISTKLTVQKELVLSIAMSIVQVPSVETLVIQG